MPLNKHKEQEKKSKPATNDGFKARTNENASFTVADSRATAITQSKMQGLADNSTQVTQLKALQQMADKRAKNVIQAKSSNEEEETIQKKSNNTGLPDTLKSGVENLSGMDVSDVKVHFNSPEPAQLNALAFAQGTNIHVGAGQEKHLPHEAWHVVQQKQGRVKPTMQMNGGVAVNDDKGLESEADLMGGKAMAEKAGDIPPIASKISKNIVQRVQMLSNIIGTTHLVQAVNGSIYKGIEGKLLEEGTPVVVETSDKIRSRRGPNQEIFEHYDAQNTQEYRWVGVVSVENEDQPKGTYVRDDTFVGGADVPRGSAPPRPSIDHRGRTQPGLSEQVFAPLHAPAWYERDLGHKNSSTANRKHAKLLAVAFNSPVEELGPAMINSAHDPDTGIALEAIGQHMTHIAPWQPGDAERDGKDRHDEAYDKTGEYFRTSQSHPLHEEFESHQQALGVYKKGITTEPVNAGWAHIASEVMGIGNMADNRIKSGAGITVREAQDSNRIARGPGAVIGHEEMARESAGMRHRLLVLMQQQNLHGLLKEVEAEVLYFNSQLSRLDIRRQNVARELLELEAKLSGYESAFEQVKQEITLNKGDKGELGKKMAQLRTEEKSDKAQKTKLNSELQNINRDGGSIKDRLKELKIKFAFYTKYSGSVVPELGQQALKGPRTTDLQPLAAVRPDEHQPKDNSFAGRLLRNRRDVKLEHLFGNSTVGDVTDVGGREHPNLVLENGQWDGNEQQGVKGLQEGWKKSGLHTNLQVRGSFGHHRPSVSPLADGRVRINPGLYPMSLLQIGIGHALGAKSGPAISPKRDSMHREALSVAVQHALKVIAADRPAKSQKIARIKLFAKHELMINLLKAQTILKARGPNPNDRNKYIPWLEKDFSKTILALENINESTHLLLSARVNEEKAMGADNNKDPLLSPGPFRSFVKQTFASKGERVGIYYVASGMQALTTAAIAAVAYRRKARNEKTGTAAGYVALHPYFEMKGQAARAAGFDTNHPSETIIADLSPLNTQASVTDQSKGAVKTGLQQAVGNDATLVPVLDATAMPLDEVGAMIPNQANNFIIVESLTKYAQLGSDKALGGRIIVVGDVGFVNTTAEIIGPVEQNADMVVSKIWFESMENMRYSH